METNEDFNESECLRLKIIERLLKEGSSAEEPINIPLSDYSSDEGSSSSSDNEGKGSVKEFSDLEGPCCHPLRAPPCSPELNVEIRKLRYSRMRKVMQELDRIYFKPLFHKKFQFLFKSKPSTFKKRKRKFNRMPTKPKIFQKSFNTSYIETAIQTADQNSNKVTIKRNSNLSDISSSATIKQTSRPQTYGVSKFKETIIKNRPKADQDQLKKQLVKVSRKLRLWLNKRQIFIMRRKLPHRLKLRLKSLHRRKKDERLLLDMPTTDPGSDLLFSTDDEYMDANAFVTTTYYGTMPRIRPNLLKSELQRHYIEEINDSLGNMPPELIITSPSNNGKQKNHTVRIIYKPVAEKYERKSQITNELPFIGQPAKRTSSWHNLNTAGQSPTLTPYKPVITKNKAQNQFYRSVPKKEPLTKEDLDIKLSLRKKIWTGMQPDENKLAIDQSRPLYWIATSHSLKTNKNANNSANLTKHATFNGVRRLENEAFLTACTQKLTEWQTMNSNPDSLNSQKTKVSLKSTVPNINEDRTIGLFKHLANIKELTTANSTTNPDNENNKIRQKRNTISKIAETSKMFKKISECKLRNNLPTTHRAMTKQTGTQHKLHGRSNKFKTGGLMVTAIQTDDTGRERDGGVAKKNKKTKLLSNKLTSSNASKANNVNYGEERRSSTHINSSDNKGDVVVMAATTAVIVRKVKTKLKKRKLSTNTTQNAINLNEIYN